MFCRFVGFLAVVRRHGGGPARAAARGRLLVAPAPLFFRNALRGRSGVVRPVGAGSTSALSRTDPSLQSGRVAFCSNL